VIGIIFAIGCRSPFRERTIKATYAGGARFKPSSGTVTQVVELYPTKTTLTSNPNPSTHGQAVTFIVTVTSTGPNQPTGKVAFKDGAVGIGSATLNGGGATLVKSTLAVGTHPITAEYLGDSSSAKSASTVLNQVVN
jgi:Big-like domain-containing protein